MQLLLIISCLFLLACIDQGSGHGCIVRVCEGNEENAKRVCADGDEDNCGQYGSIRWGKRIVHGYDIACDISKKVFAPFNGTIYYLTPFGDGTCLDQGVKIEGEGAWQGFFATIAYFKAFKKSGKVKAGELIGRAVNVRQCRNDLGLRQSNNHILFSLYKHGHAIDPTAYLHNCMCTGRICETNDKNEIIGKAFKPKEVFGIGYELKCPDKEDPPTPAYIQSVTPTPMGPDAKIPLIYSPIDGQRLGRIRLRNPNDDPNDCTNDGVFIEGADKWKDFTIRMYNTKFYKQPGQYPIKQGDPVARRLNCNGIDSVFIEFRHRGRLVNITQQILGSNCTMPEF